MAELTIVTDRKWRALTYRADVPAKALADQFEYQDADDVLDGFFCYRGVWYHLDEFMHTDMFDGWQAYASDSAFSGVLINVASDGERVMIGRYYS